MSQYPSGTPKILGERYAQLERRVEELEKRLLSPGGGGGAGQGIGSGSPGYGIAVGGDQAGAGGGAASVTSLINGGIPGDIIVLSLPINGTQKGYYDLTNIGITKFPCVIFGYLVFGCVLNGTTKTLGMNFTLTDQDTELSIYGWCKTGEFDQVHQFPGAIPFFAIVEQAKIELSCQTTLSGTGPDPTMSETFSLLGYIS